MDTSRSSIAVKNIGLSFIAKALTVICTLIQIPATLSILNKTYYGIWLTMYSVFGWLQVFDLGIGNGLRNKLTTALAKNDVLLAKKYVSTAYVSVGVLTLALITIFLLFYPFVNWTEVFNSAEFDKEKFSLLVLACCTCTLLSFFIGLIHPVLSSYQKIGVSNILLFIPQLLLLLIIYLFRFIGFHNFFVIVVVFVTLPLLVNLIYTLYAFRVRFKSVRPGLRWYNKIFLKDILGLGVRFFVIQFAALVIFSTDNIFISHLYSPSNVTEYNIIIRYFSIITVVFSVITSPSLALYTDAFAKNDYPWVRVQVKRLTRLWVLLIVTGLCMFFISPYVFHIWLGNSFNVPSMLVFLVCTYTLQSIWISIFSVPINGTGKIQLQVIYSIFSAAINIPLILLFHKLFNNVNSIIIANIVSLLTPSYFAYVQYKLVITKKSRGIFDR